MILLSYLRSLIFIFIIPISVVVWGLITIITCSLIKNKKLPTFFTTRWSLFVLWLAGVEVILEGRENLPTESSLYTFNHTSHIDIPVVNGNLLNHVRFGAKSELYKIPVFGSSLKAVGSIRVFRGDREKVIKEYAKSLKVVKEDGISIALAAEGTRNPNPPALGDFKSGPFILAIQGQMPVVPVVLYDVHKVLPKHKIFMPHWKSGQKKVRMHILKPIPTKGLNFDNRHELKKKVKKAMQEDMALRGIKNT